MATIEQDISADTQQQQEWQEDLNDVGLVRRILRARKWYGLDWWLVIISIVALGVLLFLALFPQVVAPYDPRAEAGPSLLAQKKIGSGLSSALRPVTRCAKLRKC
jgi:hypothetical protein